MGTSRNEISAWFDEGMAQGATHMLVVCDTFYYGDYPVYVMPDEEVRSRAQANNGPNMTLLMEVYCLGMDKAAQLAENRAFHYESVPKPALADRYAVGDRFPHVRNGTEYTMEVPAVADDGTYSVRIAT